MTLPLSRLVSVAELPSSGLRVSLTTTAEQNAALAAFHGIVAVGKLTATLEVKPEGAHGLHVTGTVEATVTQTCVVSLEPFETAVAEPVDVHFLTPEALEKYRAEHAKAVPEDDEVTPDEPDPIENGHIDVGALASEHMALGLDPYPRKPGAVLAVPAEPEDGTASPFAVLRGLRDEQS